MGTTITLDRILPELHSEDVQRLDARKVARMLGLSNREMADILGITERGLNKNPTSANLQNTLGKIVGILVSLKAELGGNLAYAQMWFHTGNPLLGGDTPLQALKKGRLEVLVRMVHRLEAGDSL
jgi:hypothetical protein